MKYDSYGQVYTDSNELCNLLYSNPNLDLSLFRVEDSLEYNASVAALHAELDLLTKHVPITQTVEEFDAALQRRWHMPEDYRNLDIVSYVLGLCQEEYQLQRVGEELILYQERDLFDLLRYLKYLVDTLRKNNVVWGVGRGSSVASYVLYLIGVHKIDPLYYNLDIGEFLK
jgi:hypothetical protein